MSDLIKVEGLNETITAMREARAKLPPELQLIAAEATLPVLEAVASYPPQPAPKNEDYVYMRGQGTKYMPTGKIYKLSSQQYGKTAHQFTRSDGKDIIAGVATPATYSLYLRGDVDPGSKFYDRPAYMHKGIWETLVNIVTRLLPLIQNKVNTRIQAFIRRLGGQ